LPPSREREGGGAGGHPILPPCAKYATQSGGERLSLLEITGLLHRGRRGGLRLREGLVDGHRSGESGREGLPGLSRNALELGDRDELHAGVRDGLHRWMQRVSRVDRLQRQIGKRRRLRVVGILVERRTRPWRNARPPFLLGDEVRVVLACRPRDELLRRVRILRAGWNAERPRPKPVAALAEAVVGREREANLVGDFRLFRIGHKSGRDRSVDPHAAFAVVEERQVLVEAVRRGAGGAVLLHERHVIVECRLPLWRVELWLPLLVEPARAEGIG